MVDWMIRTRPKDNRNAAFSELHYPDFNPFLNALHEVIAEASSLCIQVEAKGADPQQRQIIKSLGFETFG